MKGAQVREVLKEAETSLLAEEVPGSQIIQVSIVKLLSQVKKPGKRRTIQQYIEGNVFAFQKMEGLVFVFGQIFEMR